jgi:hypothetical protein
MGLVGNFITKLQQKLAVPENYSSLRGVLVMNTPEIPASGEFWDV